MGLKDRIISAWENPIVNEADRPNRPAAAMKEIFDSNSNELKDAFNGAIDDIRNGDVDTNFTVAISRTNIASGDTFATIFGKIRKWFIDSELAITTIRTDKPTTQFLRGDGTYAVPEVGAAANGVPYGGTINEILAKASENDFDAHWVNPQTIGLIGGIKTTVNLNAGSWSNNQITVTVQGVTAANDILVSCNPSSASVMEAWTKAGVYASAQTTNAITFTCNKVPAINLAANIMILEGVKE